MEDNRKKIRSLFVEGLQNEHNYQIEIPAGEDTVILIAPNGFGKTAFLSLINDCVSLNLRKAATHIFHKLTVTFDDDSRWEFCRERGENDVSNASRREMELRRKYSTSWRLRARPFWVSFTRYSPEGNRIEENPPELDDHNLPAVARALDRMPYFDQISVDRVRDLRTQQVLHISDALRTHYSEIITNPRAMEILSAASPSGTWQGISPVECLFVETQRLLYSKQTNSDEGPRDQPQEEILRQAASLATLLQTNYSDYAAKSQGLDRSFPSRLIERARVRSDSDVETLRAELQDIEKKRALLTEAGILVDQAETIISAADEWVPEVATALQIYAEDSREKLGIYDKIFPKVSAFRDLMSKKLAPKEIAISRESGASISRHGRPVPLEGLSSGEKHEFIMLFKLIFETSPHSLVLIDEPEISLHVVWQLEFMSDLRKAQSANPFQSIIATHSPQIFQGCNHLLVDLADQVQ